MINCYILCPWSVSNTTLTPLLKHCIKFTLKNLPHTMYKDQLWIFKKIKYAINQILNWLLVPNIELKTLDSRDILNLKKNPCQADLRIIILLKINDTHCHREAI